MRQTQPESVVKVMGGSRSRRSSASTPRPSGSGEGSALSNLEKLCNRKTSDWRRRHLDKRRPTTTRGSSEKRAKPSRVTPRPPSNDKAKEKTWSESESDEDDDEDLVPSINASIAEDNVARARKAAAGFKAAPDVVDDNFVASKTYTGTEKASSSRRARRASAIIETLYQCPFYLRSKRGNGRRRPRSSLTWPASPM